MESPEADLLSQFQCQHPIGECYVDLKVANNPDYQIQGTRVLYQGNEIGDLNQNTLVEIFCYRHCAGLGFERLGDGPPPKPKLRIVKRHTRTPAFNLGEFLSRGDAATTKNP